MLLSFLYNYLVFIAKSYHYFDNIAGKYLGNRVSPYIFQNNNTRMANNELSSVTFRTNLNLMSIICFIAIIVAFVTSSTSANTAVNLQGK
jgi:hypothetical protein